MEKNKKNDRKPTYEQARHGGLVTSLKNCIEIVSVSTSQTLNLYKTIGATPKEQLQINDVV